MSVHVQTDDFNVNDAQNALRSNRTDVGAVCSFVGTVRDLSGDKTTHLTLEHYPGMTESVLEEIRSHALERFDLLDAGIWHRVGKLQAGENIVMVIALAAHRHAAFDGANYMMDRLKTDAPFWKLEGASIDERWIESRQSDYEARQAWDISG